MDKENADLKKYQYLEYLRYMICGIYFFLEKSKQEDLKKELTAKAADYRAGMEESKCIWCCVYSRISEMGIRFR